MNMPVDIAEPTAFLAEIAQLESAEDFLDYFAIEYDPKVVQVCRLHILQRFHDYLKHRFAATGPDFAQYRACLAEAYADFVRSDAQTEKVFRVFKRAAGIATVPLSSLRRARR